MTSEAVRFVGVGKTFPGVRALHDITFGIGTGSVHALCGENGAGKSTLGKILAGIHPPDSGHLVVFGERVRFESPRQALAKGIGMVHQELSFCENLSVAENLCLAALPARGVFVDREATDRRAREMLETIEATIDVRALVGGLPLGQRQMVQIAAAVGAGARVIVFDEPTSSLSQRESERLYHLIARLRARGVTSIYVSHRMDEIFRLCDDVTVLRDGRQVATQPLASSDEGGLVQMMIGRSIESVAGSTTPAAVGEELLRVTGLSSPAKFHDVSFSLRAGEVLGLAGLVGAGRSEIAHALFGLDPESTGDILMQGKRVEIRTPPEAMAQGERLRVRAPGQGALAAGLSGGNQQKLVLAKWLAARARILILDEPTRGVDVGAKGEIHALIDQLARDGNAILLISSELPELLRLSTRILVVRGGRIAGEVSRAEASQDGLLRLMAGIVNPVEPVARPQHGP